MRDTALKFGDKWLVRHPVIAVAMGFVLGLLLTPLLHTWWLKVLIVTWMTVSGLYGLRLARKRVHGIV